MQKSLFILLCLFMPFITRAQFKKYIVDSSQQKKSSTYFLEINGKLLFDSHKLWTSDGTDAGTYSLADTIILTEPVGMLNGKLIFYGCDLNYVPSIWTLDSKTGTIQHLSSDVISGYYTANSCFYKNKLYFVAKGKTTGNEIWYTDGTPAGTAMLTDLVPGVNNSQPEDFIVYKNKMLFCSRTADGKNALWETDGTESGTVMIKKINNTGNSRCFSDPVIFNNKIYFTGNDSCGMEPWVTDGTTAGTFMLADIWPGKHSSLSLDVNLRRVYTEYKGKLYFAADAGSPKGSSLQVWCTDGTKTGTVSFKHIGDKIHPFMEVLKDKLFFLTDSTNTTQQLWMTDGNENGTTLVKTFPSANNYLTGFKSNSFTVFDDHLYFIEEYNNEGPQLWRTDVTGKTEVVLPSVYKKNALRMSDGMFVYKNNLYFKANYDASGAQLWSYKVPAASVVSTTYNQNISIYPNPARNFFTIAAGNNISGLVTLRDIAGRIILSEKIEGTYCHIALPQLPSGIYNADIEVNNQHTIRKLVIE